MPNNMFSKIFDMSDNIGSLTLFLKNPKNKEYLHYLNSNIPKGVSGFKISEKVYYLLNGIKDLLLCECGSHRSFIGFKSGYRPTCGKKKCFVEKRKQTCMHKWGVDNPKKWKEIIEKEKENIKIKWGGQHYMLNKEVRSKFKKTMIDNWGVEWAQQSNLIKNKSINSWNNNINKNDIIKKRCEKIKNKTLEEKLEIKNKRANTILEKWGTHYMNNEDIKNKIKSKNLDLYGFDSPFKNKLVAEKRIISYRKRTKLIISEMLPKDYHYISHGYNKNLTGIDIKLKHSLCDNDFIIHQGYFKKRLLENSDICLLCNPVLSGKSKREIEVYNFIKENYKEEIILNSKNIISKEVDIYLPHLKLAFEFNGLYWHSELHKEKAYHLNKTKECLDASIQLIHIWEDDWDFKKEIVKSMILNKLGKTKKIWARSCKIKEINDNELVRDFLEKNHIQGFVGSRVKLGLHYNGELISIMTFGALRRSLGQKSKLGSWELLRFCNKLNYSVVGGASKLFKYFLNNYNIDEILSYSDSSRGVGHLYEQLKFKLISETQPNYYWIIGGIRKHRFNFRKDKLIEGGYNTNKSESQIMHENGYYRIFDCGSKKWKFTSKS
jgi:hypothetical protein